MKTASAPFNNPDTDLILRSSDKVNFLVFKNLLSLCSPIFHDILQLPQPVSEGRARTDGRPVVQMSEESAALDPLLRFCYPVALGGFPGFRKPLSIILVLGAARKYGINGLDELAKKTLEQPGFATATEVFIIARHFDWPREVFRATCRHLEDALIPDEFPILKYADPVDLTKIFRYHQSCGRAARKLGGDFDWLTSALDLESDLGKWLLRSTSGSDLCIEVKAGRCIYLPPWLVTDIKQIAEDLFERPCRKTIMEAHVRLACQVPAEYSFPDMPKAMKIMEEFIRIFAYAVDRRVSEELHPFKYRDMYGI